MTDESRELAEVKPPDRELAVTLDVQRVADAFENAVVLAKVVERRFKDGHHYMRIPGTPPGQRPHLKDPGASLIANGFFLRPEFHVLERSEDEDGHISIALECRWHHILTGIWVSTGIGAATSREIKYAYRWVPRTSVPAGTDITQIPRKANRQGDSLYKIDNPDIGDLFNTIWKMAAKRAEGDGILHLPGCSELFAGYAIEPPRGKGGAQKATDAPPASQSATAAELEQERKDLFGGTTAGDQDPYFCPQHEMKWFKSVKMKAFAHPIRDTDEWCSMPIGVRVIPPQEAHQLLAPSQDTAEV